MVEATDYPPGWGVPQVKTGPLEGHGDDAAIRRQADLYRQSQSYVNLSEIPMSEVDELQAKARLTKVAYYPGPDAILYFDMQETIEDMIKLQIHGKSIEFDKE